MLLRLGLYLVLGGLCYAASQWLLTPSQTIAVAATEPAPQPVEQSIHFSLKTLDHNAQTLLQKPWQTLTAEQQQQLLQRLADNEILFREGLKQSLEKTDSVIIQRLIKNQRFIEQRHLQTTADEASAKAALSHSAAAPNAANQALYQTALMLQMHHHDPVVKRRMQQIVRQQLENASPIASPTQEQLQAFIEQHPEDFSSKQRFSFRQLFFKRGADARQRALDYQYATKTGSATADGDTSPLPEQLNNVTQTRVQRHFGDDFAQRLAALNVSQQWQGPLPSAYGYHLVQLQEVTAPHLQPLASVERQARYAWLAMMKKRNLQQAMEALRNQYPAQVTGIETAPEQALEKAAVTVEEEQP